MVNIRCWKCGGKASGISFEDARTKLNHAVGLSRGIKCGDNYNCVEEIKDPKALKPESVPVETTTNIPEPTPQTQKDDNQGNSPTDKKSTKQSKNNSKKIHSY